MGKRDPKSAAYQQRKARLEKALEAFLVSPDLEKGILDYMLQTREQAYRNQASRLELRTDGKWIVAFNHTNWWNKFILPFPHLFLWEKEYPVMHHTNIHSLYEKDPDMARSLCLDAFPKQREKMADDLRKTLQWACERGE